MKTGHAWLDQFLATLPPEAVVRQRDGYLSILMRPTAAADAMRAAAKVSPRPAPTVAPERVPA